MLGGVLAFAASAGLPIGSRLGALALVADPACALMLALFGLISLREQLHGAKREG